MAPSPPTGVDEREAPTAPRSIAIRVLYGATFLNFFCAAVYFTAIPLYVTNELGGTGADVGNAVGAFFLSAVLFRPSIGRGADRYGRRPFLLLAFGGLAATSLALTVATTIPAVIAVRLAQGVSGAAFYTTGAAMATDLAPPERRAGAIARFSIFLYSGFALGPVAGEYFTAASGFRPTFVGVAVLAAVGFVLAWTLPETGTVTPRPATSSADDANDPDDIDDLAAAATAVAEAPAPIGRRRSGGEHGRKRRARLLHPGAVIPGLVLGTAGMGYAAVIGFSALYARDLGLASSDALYVVFAVTVLSVRLSMTGLADRFPPLSIAAPGMGMASAGLALMAVATSPSLALVGVALFGLGFALVFPALLAFTVNRVPDRERGEAVGSFTAFMDVGQGVGNLAVGALVDAAGFTAGYGVPSAIAALGFVGALLLRRRHRP